MVMTSVWTSLWVLAAVAPSQRIPTNPALIIRRSPTSRPPSQEPTLIMPRQQPSWPITLHPPMPPARRGGTSPRRRTSPSRRALVLCWGRRSMAAPSPSPRQSPRQSPSPTATHRRIGSPVLSYTAAPTVRSRPPLLSSEGNLVTHGVIVGHSRHGAQPCPRRQRHKTWSRDRTRLARRQHTSDRRRHREATARMQASLAVSTRTRHAAVAAHSTGHTHRRMWHSTHRRTR